MKISRSLLIVIGLFPGAVWAQTPTPAQMGITTVNPNAVQIRDSSGTWTTLGTIDPTTHVFTPAGLPPLYTLPIASTTVLGGVKVDGTTITVTGGGVISGTPSGITAGTTPASGFTAGQIMISDGTKVQAAGNGIAYSLSAESLNAGITHLGGLYFNGGTYGEIVVDNSMLEAIIPPSGTNATLGIFSGASPTRLKVYNTFTDTSNGEWGTFDWQTTPNVLTIGTVANGTGTQRLVNIVGSSVMMLPDAGAGYHGTYISPSGVDIGNFGALTFANNGYAGTTGTSIRSFSSNMLGVYNNYDSTVGHMNLNVYNTLTDLSNGEWGTLDWQTTPNVLTIGAKANGTGTQRPVNIVGNPVTINSAAPLTTITKNSTPTSTYTAGQFLTSDGSKAQADGLMTSYPNATYGPVVRFGGVNSWLGMVGPPWNLTYSGDGFNGQGVYPVLSISNNPIGINMGLGGFVGWAPDGEHANPDAAFERVQAAGVSLFDYAAPATPTSFRVYSNYIDANNGEWGAFDWQTVPNTLTIGAEKNGTGTLRPVNIVGSALTFNGAAIGGSSTITANSTLTSGFAAGTGGASANSGPLLMSDGTKVQATNASAPIQLGTNMWAMPNTFGAGDLAFIYGPDGGAYWMAAGINIPAGGSTGANITVGTNGYFGWANSTGSVGGSFMGLYGMIGNLRIAEFSGGVNATTLRVDNTFTDGSNYETGVLDWLTTPNTLTIGAQKAGTGTLRAVNLVGSSISINGAAPNTNGGIGTATTSSIAAGSIETGGGSGVAPVGLAAVAAGSYLKSNGVTTIPAWQTFGTGAQTAVNTAINTTGGLVTQSGVLASGALLLGGGSATAITSTTTAAGITAALAIAPGTTGSPALQSGAITTGNLVKWNGATGVADAGVAPSTSGIISNGTQPTITGSGGTCATTTKVGGATAGTVVLSAVCATTNTIVWTGMPTAPNGWNCDAVDRTTRTAGPFIESASTTTGFTLTMGATSSVAADVLQWKCMGY